MSKPKFRYTFRIFSSSTHLCRNKNEIYNSEDRPIPVLDEKFRLKLKDGYKHPRSIPAIAPSEEFTKNVLKIFETVYSSHKDHLKSCTKTFEETLKTLKKYTKQLKKLLQR